jgi:hypothetical protein
VSQAKKVILIPHWVHETLTRHHLPVCEALNFHALRRIVSANDLAGYILLNRLAHHTGISENNGAFDAMGSVFHASLTPEHTKYLYDVVYPLTEMEQFKVDLMDRLFSPDSRSPRYEEPFNIYDLSSDYEGVVINPGFFTGDVASFEHVFSLVEGVVKALYVYAPLHEVASTPVFLRYLGLLSKKRIMV